MKGKRIQCAFAVSILDLISAIKMKSSLKSFGTGGDSPLYNIYTGYS